MIHCTVIVTKILIPKVRQRLTRWRVSGVPGKTNNTRTAQKHELQPCDRDPQELVLWVSGGQGVGGWEKLARLDSARVGL